MRKVKTRAHYGQPVVLDQCPACGGLWFDNLEMVTVKRGEAKTIEALDAVKLRQGASTRPRLLCPKDKSELITFHDQNFPSSIQIERCQRCGGFWFNRGEFTAYQDHLQGKTMAEKSETDKKLAAQIEGMLRVYSDDGFYDTLGAIGSFLSTPIGDSGLEPGRPEDRERARQVNMVINIISGLLRLFIRRGL